MKMAEATEVTTECGFCCRRGAYLQDPKILPCSHIYCAGCLTDCIEHNGVIQCNTCKETYDIALDSLPSAAHGGGSSVPCDVCTRRGGASQPAVQYCTVCEKKYCDEHLKFHDVLHDDHPLIVMDEYRVQARRLQTVFCTEHSEHSVGMGCKACLTVFCVQCVDGIDSCTDGEPHRLATLDALVAELTEDINELNAELIKKEEKLSSLFKLASKAVSDFQTSTDEIIELLHRTRDEQIEAIKAKYATLEAELIALRTESQTKMSSFMEDDVGATLADLSRHRLRIEASLRHNHQVDIVNGYKDTREEIRKLVQTKIPAFAQNDVASIRSKGEKRDIEFLISAESELFCELGLTLLHTTQVARCSTVCHHKGFTYVGQLKGAVHKIGLNYQQTKLLSTGHGSVHCITVYKDQLYVLVCGLNFTICVYSLTGQFIRQWSFAGAVTHYNKLTIISDQVVVPDRRNKSFILYSLTGDELRQVRCHQLGQSFLAQCVVDDDTIIVSDHASSQVFRMNVNTGQVIWTSPNVTKPLGVACYRQHYVCVASDGSDKIHILSTQTGERLTQLTLTKSCRAFDLHTFGDTLIVPSCDDKKVMFYDLANCV